jgi:hypothetical protein
MLPMTTAIARLSVTACLSACFARLALPILIAVTLTACAGPGEPLTRPDQLSRIQPTNSSAVILTRGRAWYPEHHSPRPHGKPAVVVDLPRQLSAKIVVPKHPLQCVPYAREHSNVQIHGDAWTWWGQAEGRYRRGQRPQEGAVVVLKRRQNSLGHVAVVEEVIDNRTMIVSHANWLRRGRIHESTPVIDVSAANDWSELRFWNAEGGHYGGGVYKPYGFIYGDRRIASR